MQIDTPVPESQKPRRTETCSRLGCLSSSSFLLKTGFWTNASIMADAKLYPVSDEKKYDGTGSSDVEISTVKKSSGLYDPMQETIATRLGLTWESFKAAPGSTGGQVGQLGFGNQ